MQTPPTVLTVPEVAEYLRVTPKTVYALIKRGELPSFRIGRAVRCRHSDVEQFIQHQAGEGSDHDEGGSCDAT